MNPGRVDTFDLSKKNVAHPVQQVSGKANMQTFRTEEERLRNNLVILVESENYTQTMRLPVCRATVEDCLVTCDGRAGGAYI